jgi:hypothetical protein
VAIADAIASHYLSFRAGERAAPVNADGSFDRSRQATLLFDALERIAATPAPSR